MVSNVQKKKPHLDIVLLWSTFEDLDAGLDNNKFLGGFQNTQLQGGKAAAARRAS